MKQFIFLSILMMSIIGISCQDRFNVKNDQNIRKLFDNNEIEVLNSIVKYTDEMILSKSSVTDIEHAYHNYFESLSKQIKEESKIPSAFSEKDKYKFLESLDKATFNEIFRVRTHLDRVRYNDTIIRNVDNIKLLKLNTSGKFMDYLATTGENDEFYKKLHESMKVAGDLPASYATWFPVNHKDFNFSVVKNRLWSAVYLFRMEGHINDKIEYYNAN